MTALFWILGATALIVACRYVPGFKCITFCRYKTIKGNRAKKKLKSMCELVDSTQRDHYGEYIQRVNTLNTEGLSSKKLLNLYHSTSPFGCNSFDQPSWLTAAREILKERIAEMQLLES